MSRSQVRSRGGPAGRVVASLRGALWPIPTIGVALAVAAGVVLPAVDRALESSGDSPFQFAFGGGPSAARDVLAAIAGSLISVTGLTFSLTVVALQLGSSQFTPRVLQTFATDRTVQLTLAQLVATFVFALTVLRSVRTESASLAGNSFVPRLSVTVSYLLTIVSVLALVLFLGHLARLLRVETVLRDVHHEAGIAFARELRQEEDGRAAELPLPSGPGTTLTAASSGFVVDVDDQRLLRAAAEAGVVIALAVRMGDSVIAGVPVAHVWPAAGTDVDRQAVQKALDAALSLGFERRPDRDVAYPLRKIIDVAVRALSPGVNDPTTAVHALSHAAALLGDLLRRPLWLTERRDDDGVLRLLLPQWTPDQLLDLVTEEPLQFAGGQPAVLRRLAALLREVAWCSPPRLLDEPLRRRLSETVELAAETTRIPAEECRSWERRLGDALGGRWPAEQ